MGSGLFNRRDFPSIDFFSDGSSRFLRQFEQFRAQRNLLLRNENFYKGLGGGCENIELFALVIPFGQDFIQVGNHPSVTPLATQFNQLRKSNGGLGSLNPLEIVFASEVLHLYAKLRVREESGLQRGGVFGSDFRRKSR